MSGDNRKAAAAIDYYREHESILAPLFSASSDGASYHAAVKHLIANYELLEPLTDLTAEDLAYALRLTSDAPDERYDVSGN